MPFDPLEEEEHVDMFDVIAEFNEDALSIDGYDDCIIGICEMFGRPPLIAYDRKKIIDKLAEDMTIDEAEEYFEFNIVGGWMGENTPVFIIRLDET